MKADFTTMTIRELKQYVLEHRDDRAAFQALMERIDAQPPDQVYNDVDGDIFSQLLERHYPSISPK
ncbi:DUF6887 family protein [[Phormidium] sp. ETS-05]|uniref:DUF6887 family protein n=1 Tax=[Phormidium] sp. ETS-05 TaxID=222819 RepID=UPI0018EF054B|nr:hypothetical protein [[Phormidium] sp. ETS-05]